MPVRTLSSLLSIALVAVPCVAQQDIPAAVRDKVARSCAWLQIRRALSFRELPSAGAAFFIHPDGYLLTSGRLVAEHLRAGKGNQQQEISSKILGLTALVDPGGPDQRELAATVVARDEKLALLRVDYSPRVWVDVGDLAEPAAGRGVWSVSFYGGSGDSNPEPVTARGKVASLGSAAQGSLDFRVVLSPAIGLGGGPVLDNTGTLIGVLLPPVDGGTTVSLALAADEIRQFVDRWGARVSLDPTVILDTAQPIVVTVKPLLAAGEPLAGELTLDGDDIPTREVALVQDGGVLEATVAIPAPLPGRRRPGYYRATVTLKEPGGAVRLRRSYRLQLSLEGLPSALGSPVEVAGSADADSAAPTGPRPPEEAGASLKDAARDIRLSRSGEGDVVIDNSAVEKPVVLDETCYRLVTDDVLRWMLQEYDRITIRLGWLEKEERDRNQRWGYAYSYDERREKKKHELQEQKRKLVSRLGEYRIARCPNDCTYVPITLALPDSEIPCSSWTEVKLR